MSELYGGITFIQFFVDADTHQCRDLISMRTRKNKTTVCIGIGEEASFNELPERASALATTIAFCLKMRLCCAESKIRQKGTVYRWHACDDGTTIYAMCMKSSLYLIRPINYTYTFVPEIARKLICSMNLMRC